MPALDIQMTSEPFSEYAKLAEERLKAATARILTLESDLQLAKKHLAEEKISNIGKDQDIAELTAFVAEAKHERDAAKREQGDIAVLAQNMAKELADCQSKHEQTLAIVRELQDAAKTHTEQVEDLRRQKTASDALAETAAKNMHDLKTELTQAQELRESALKTQATKANAIIDGLHDKIKNMEAEAAREAGVVRAKANGIIDSLHDKITMLKEEHESANMEHKAEVDKLKCERNEMRRKLEISATAVSDMKHAERERSKAEQEASSQTQALRERVTELEGAANAAQARSMQAQNNIADLESRLSAEQTSKSDAEAQLAAAKETARKALQQVEAVKKACADDLAAAKAKANAIIDSLHDKLETKDAQLTRLHSVAMRHDVVGRADRQVGQSTVVLADDTL